LEFFKARPNIEELKKLSQPELAAMYAEHCVNWALAQQQADKAKAAKEPGHIAPQRVPDFDPQP
jgi:hypothetical protein